MNEDIHPNPCPHCQTKGPPKACDCRQAPPANSADNIIPFVRRRVQPTTRTPPLSDPDGPSAA